MKRASDARSDAPIVRLLDTPAGGSDGDTSPPDAAAQLRRARAFAEPLLVEHRLSSGEAALAHADGVAAILGTLGAAPSLRAAAYLVYAAGYLQRPEEVIAKAFGAPHASLVAHTRKLEQVLRAARETRLGQRASPRDPKQAAAARAQQTDRVRRMLLAFSKDLRVVLLRLASRLQTLRWIAATKQPCPEDASAEALHVYAPLANRLGLWQIKWELEDLAFRFLDPTEYHRIAKLLDERRVEREAHVEAFRARLAVDLAAHGIAAEVQGRPKHLYSIWKKMQGKRLGIAQVLDLRAVRVIVAEVPACYAVLGRVHELHRPVAGEFDDYIERPKPNGYQSLHTVVEDRDGRPVEVQIRTRAMHEKAEQGIAAHWAYKDAGVKGYGGVAADREQQAQIAAARKAVLRQLLEWERETAEPARETDGAAERDAGRNVPADAPPAIEPRLYVFTPAAEVVELTAGATPVDFAYALHTDLGHRCRGARVDGAIVPLATPLVSGQTVEIVVAKEGGPSLDWLKAESGYLKSPRARAKVRAWFNQKAQRETIARGREAVERLLQREGRSSMRLDELAQRLGFGQADALFEIVGKDEFSLRNIEALLRPPEPPPDPDEQIATRRFEGEAQAPKGGVLVVGVESLMTSLARCCRPAPPDPIGGYVTRGKGVAVHRAGCSNFRQMALRAPERVIPVAWGAGTVGTETARYPVDVVVEAADRPGLLRDLSELFARERMNVVGVKTQSLADARGGTAWMTFTIEVGDATRLGQVLQAAGRVPGVRVARRK